MLNSANPAGTLLVGYWSLMLWAAARGRDDDDRPLLTLEIRVGRKKNYPKKTKTKKKQKKTPKNTTNNCFLQVFSSR